MPNDNEPRLFQVTTRCEFRQLVAATNEIEAQEIAALWRDPQLDEERGLVRCHTSAVEVES